MLVVRRYGGWDDYYVEVPSHFDYVDNTRYLQNSNGGNYIIKKSSICTCIY